MCKYPAIVKAAVMEAKGIAEKERCHPFVAVCRMFFRHPERARDMLNQLGASLTTDTPAVTHSAATLMLWDCMKEEIV